MSEVELSPHEAALLLAFPEAQPETPLTDLAAEAGLEMAQARSAIERLKLKALVDQASETVTRFVALNEAGEAMRDAGLPELRLWATLAERGAVPIKDLQDREDMDKKDAGAAFGALKKAKVLKLDKGQASLAEGADQGPWTARQALLAAIGEAGRLPVAEMPEEQAALLEDKRIKGYIKIIERKARSYALSAAGQGALPQAKAVESHVAQLTPEMLADGSWRDKVFRSYAIGQPPQLVAGKRNPYRRFLDKVKSTLIGLGFEEMRGSLVEPEFWGMDALFMPQFHPARDIHDVYFVEHPTHAREIPEPHLSRVAAAHEGRESSGSRGWGYTFDAERTKRLILRSQGTVLSARKLGEGPATPGKYFSIARCFRYDEVDATHAPDFFQIEGIVVSHEMTLRHLLGLLQIFARELAQAEDIRAVPAYFPFTEPSVEIHMKHRTKGWMELGGAGIFRPEVSRSLGVEAPVIAWGLGLDRMYMTAEGVNDIRELFTNNLSRGLEDLRAH